MSDQETNLVRTKIYSLEQYVAEKLRFSPAIRTAVSFSQEMNRLAESASSPVETVFLQNAADKLLLHLFSPNLSIAEVMKLPPGNSSDSDLAHGSQAWHIFCTLYSRADKKESEWSHQAQIIKQVQGAMLFSLVLDSLHISLVDGFLWETRHPKHEAISSFVNYFLEFAKEWMQQKEMSGNLLTLVSSEKQLKNCEKLIEDFFHLDPYKNAYYFQSNVMGNFSGRLVGFNCYMFNPDSMKTAILAAAKTYNHFAKQNSVIAVPIVVLQNKQTPKQRIPIRII